MTEIPPERVSDRSYIVIDEETINISKRNCADIKITLTMIAVTLQSGQFHTIPA